MIHTRQAAAIASGLCKTVLINHGESGRSGVGRTRNLVAPTEPRRQVPSLPASGGGLGWGWADGPPTLFTIPVLRYVILLRLTPAQ